MKGTSAKAYQELLTKKIINKRAFEVVRVLTQYGPMTAGEIFQVNQTRHMGHDVVKGSICARLSELELQGVAEVVGQKKCPLTGRTASIWRLTGAIPKDKVKAPPKNFMKVTHAQLWLAFLETLGQRLDPAGKKELFPFFNEFLNALDLIRRRPEIL